MVYRKRTYKKRYSRPGYKSCGKMVYSDARKALTIAAGIKRLINVEVKNFDVQQSNVQMSNVPVIIQLSNIPQGDTTSTRDGSQCKVLALELDLFMTRNSNGVVSTVRLMLVCDKQTNQAIYLNTDLMADVTTIDNLVSPMNLDNKFRFQVLWDRVFVISSGWKGARHFKKTFRMSKILRFDGNTSAIADLTSSSLSLVQMTNDSASEASITMFSRLRYVDN